MTYYTTYEAQGKPREEGEAAGTSCRSRFDEGWETCQIGTNPAPQSCRFWRDFLCAYWRPQTAFRTYQYAAFGNCLFFKTLSTFTYCPTIIGKPSQYGRHAVSDGNISLYLCLDNIFNIV